MGQDDSSRLAYPGRDNSIEGLTGEAVAEVQGIAMEQGKQARHLEGKEQEAPCSGSTAFAIPKLQVDGAFNQDLTSLTSLKLSGPEELAEEEEEEEEEDSGEAYLARGDRKRCSLFETSVCQPACSLSVQNSLRRRTHSEGSLLQEPRAGQCFTSDTSLNYTEMQGPTPGWTLPSPQSLKKQLMKNGGSIHQLTLLFVGNRKVGKAPCVCDNGGWGALESTVLLEQLWQKEPENVQGRNGLECGPRATASAGSARALYCACGCFLASFRGSRSQRGRLDKAFGLQPTFSAYQKCPFSSLFRELV